MRTGRRAMWWLGGVGLVAAATLAACGGRGPAWPPSLTSTTTSPTSTSVGGGSTTTAPTSTTAAPTTSTAPTTTTVAEPADVAALRSLGLRPLAEYTRTPLVSLGFESVDEFAGWYITPQTSLTHHELWTTTVHGGTHAHHAWVTGANTANVEPDGPNHRGYPTIQLSKRPGGCVSPCLVTVWAWADIPLRPGEWFQLATLTSSASDIWLPAQVVNVGSEGWLHVMHVPSQGLKQWTYQRTDLPFPTRQWVRVDILVDYRSTTGAIAAFQDGVLMSAAPLDPTGTNALGVLNQVHAGMYAPPTVASGVILNDDLTVARVR